MWIPKEVVLIRGRRLLEENMVFLRLAQFHFYCTFFDTTFSYHIPLKHVHLKDQSINLHAVVHT